MHDLALEMSLGEMVERDLWRDLSNGQCRALADDWNFPIQEQPQEVLDRAGTTWLTASDLGADRTLRGDSLDGASGVRLARPVVCA